MSNPSLEFVVETLYFILFLAAAILFLAAAVNVTARVNLMALGLFAWVLVPLLRALRAL